MNKTFSVTLIVIILLALIAAGISFVDIYMGGRVPIESQAMSTSPTASVVPAVTILNDSQVSEVFMSPPAFFNLPDDIPDTAIIRTVKSSYIPETDTTNAFMLYAEWRFSRRGDPVLSQDASGPLSKSDTSAWISKIGNMPVVWGVMLDSVPSLAGSIPFKNKYQILRMGGDNPCGCPNGR